MPLLGDLIKGRQRGLKCGATFIYAACVGCGKARWVEKKGYDSGQYRRCRICSGKIPKHGMLHSKSPWMDGVKDVKRASDVDRRGDSLYCLVTCPICHIDRWVRSSSYRKNPDIKCNSCAAREAICKLPRFRGRKTKHCNGYVMVWLPPSDSFHCMTTKTHYVMEHRLVMARALNRPLTKSEFVHHKNGIINDNRIENLELVSRHDHAILNKLCSHCELRKEIRLLRWQVKQLNERITILSTKPLWQGV